jgi:hypothetical protein
VSDDDPKPQNRLRLTRWLASIIDDPRLEGEYLFRCVAEIRDACTVEDAIYWHSEIINEIAIELKAAQACPKREGSFSVEVLEDCERHHLQCLSNLTAIVRNSSQFVWRPPRPT